MGQKMTRQWRCASYEYENLCREVSHYDGSVTGCHWGFGHCYEVVIVMVRLNSIRPRRETLLIAGRQSNMTLKSCSIVRPWIKRGRRDF
uniref:Uncharacterized protein n=1 Tax=Strigamia maritima TaxID=126957 RepID=T1J0S4_STRMM